MLEKLLSERILLLDGAMGTMIQRARLAEEDYRGARFRDWQRELRGNNDLLSLTQPALIRDIHAQYLAAGADIIETNTFNSTSIALADYGMQDLARELNREAATLARTAARRAESKTPKRPRFVAGVLGPTNKTASLSPDVNDPGFREIDWDTLVDVYKEQAAALVEGGVDFILLETVFDTLNAKAGIMAVRQLEQELGHEVPIMLSMTLTDLSGRNLSGHTVEAFWHAVRHAKPLTIGLNCSFGATQLRPHVKVLSEIADTLIMVYPNAGLPNELGEYDEMPHTTAELVGEWAQHGQVNILGGCCGSTPEHIAAMAQAVTDLPPRKLPELEPVTRLAGLEPFVMAA